MSNRQARAGQGRPPECLDCGVATDAALLAQRLLLLAVHGCHPDHAVQRFGHLAPLGRQLAAVATPRRVELDQPHPAVAVALGERVIRQILRSKCGGEHVRAPGVHKQLRAYKHPRMRVRDMTCTCV